MLRSFYPRPAFEAPNDPAGGVVQPWYTGKADEATAGYFKAHGWDKDPIVAAIEAGKAHRHAETKLGIPSNEVVRFPTKADDPAWSNVWERLGVPKVATGYDLSNVKIGDKALDPALADTLQKVAHSLNLPKDRAPILAQAIAKLEADRTSATQADHTAKIAEEKTALDKNWGANKEANMLIARNAAATLGVTPAEINALESVVGYSKVMEMLRNVGIRMGEDKFIRNENKPGGGVMSKAEAMDKKAELFRDQDWVNRYRAGSAAEGRQMLDLLKIISAPA